jgi:periplasmic copper chaperone A
MFFKSYALALALSVFVASCSGGESLSVRDAWARPALAGDNGAVYFTIENPTSVDDVLTGASTEITTKTELHMSSMDSAGVMTMRQQSSVPVPAGGSAFFEPGGLHVMLIGLQSELNTGDRFEIQLNFENAGDLRVEVEVREP